jgi:hypothetical protein
MLRQYIKQLHLQASRLANMFSVKEEATELLQELTDLLNDRRVLVDDTDMLSADQNMDQLRILGAIWLALGEDHPVQRITFFAESEAYRTKVKIDFGTILWEQACKRYPKVIASGMKKHAAYTPESLTEQPIGANGVRTAVPLQAFLSAMRCNLVFIAFIDAGLGNHEMLDRLRPLLEMVLWHRIFPIGFTDNERVVLIPRLE